MALFSVTSNYPKPPIFDILCRLSCLRSGWVRDFKFTFFSIRRLVECRRERFIDWPIDSNKYGVVLKVMTSNRKSGSKCQTNGSLPYFHFRFGRYRPLDARFRDIWPIPPPCRPWWPDNRSKRSRSSAEYYL